MLGTAVRMLVTLPANVLGIVCDHLGKLSDPEWVEATKKFLRKENPWGVKLTDVYHVVINYTHTLGEMIQAGQYDGGVNDNITAEHFPISGEGMVEAKLELVHFNRVMESEEVLKEFAKAGLEPAKIEHLLAFGAKYPDVQRQFPIIALGSVWQFRSGSHFVAVLWGGSFDRYLGLLCFDFGWHEDCRFLAVRQIV